MLSESDLRELLDFTAPEPVLSVYLNTEPSGGNADAYKLRLRNMLKAVNLPHDVSAVERYFNLDYKWSGRGVAVFSCAARGFFKAHPLALPVRDMYVVGDRPSVKPLANLMDNYGGYGVVLVDKQGARLFSFHMGELKEQEGVLGEVVKHTKHGGASSVHGQRGGTAGKTQAVEETIERNMKEVVESSVKFFEDNHVRRVLISGSDDNVAQFRGLLPKAWQSLVVGSFPMSMSASHPDVLNRTMQIGLDADKQRELHLIDTLITRAAKGSSAVTGLEKTLEAINQSRVQTLVLVENFRHPGFMCAHCNTLTSLGDKKCDGCGEKPEQVQDIVELAVSSVLRHNGEVEMVPPVPALVRAGSAGAILRY